MKVAVLIQQASHHPPPHPAPLEIGMHQQVRKVDHQMPIGNGVGQTDEPPGHARRHEGVRVPQGGHELHRLLRRRPAVGAVQGQDFRLGHGIGEETTISIHALLEGAAASPSGTPPSVPSR